VAKNVEFKLNDTLLHRRRGDHDSSEQPPRSTPVPETAGVVAVEPPPKVRRPARSRSSKSAKHDSPDQPNRPTRPVERAEVVAVDRAAMAQGPDEVPDSPPPGPVAPTRPISVQTSVLLPPLLWDRLADLATGAGSLTTANRLLIAILHGRGPRDLAQAVEDLEAFLSLPADQSHVGELWEERNVRLPIELRTRFDRLTRELAAAGVVQATRANLVTATLMLRGPNTAEDARTLMADLRAEAFRRALAGADSPAGN
jgi:hypothetical protein